jgi:CBS domain-containing protein
MGDILSHPVGELATRSAVTIDEGTTLRAAAHRLWAEAIGAVVVTRGDRPVGIASERDIVTALAVDADPDITTVGEVMTSDMLVDVPHDRLLTAAIDMVDREIRHLPLFDAAGRCTGVVSMRELVRPLLIDALESGC